MSQEGGKRILSRDDVASGTQEFMPLPIVDRPSPALGKNSYCGLANRRPPQQLQVAGADRWVDRRAGKDLLIGDAPRKIFPRQPVQETQTLIYRVEPVLELLENAARLITTA